MELERGTLRLGPFLEGAGKTAPKLASTPISEATTPQDANPDSLRDYSILPLETQLRLGEPDQKGAFVLIQTEVFGAEASTVSQPP